MQKQFKMTVEGIAELEAELKLLVSKRSEMAERIKSAREFGDLAENAEYSSARQEQERAESRITDIDHILKNAEIIKQPKNKDVVTLGNTVMLKNSKGEKTFTLVGSVEADPTSGKISDESPIGKALIGKKLGEEVEIVTPLETTKYKISSVK
jgi:transcription elongation factor GreA